MRSPSPNPSPLPRAAGILLHPTALPTPFGIGDLGPVAYQFIDFLHRGNQQFWQVLPLGPTGYADSPYQCLSAFAGNPLLISPENLVAIHLVTEEEIENALRTHGGRASEKPAWVSSPRIAYGPVQNFKYELLQCAFHRFQTADSVEINGLRLEFHAFRATHESWLPDFALFYSLKRHFQMRSWISWDPPYALRDPAHLQTWKQTHAEDLLFYQFVQWLFARQWQALRAYAHQIGIQLIGDMPIFVAHDSADVWMNREFFTLTPSGQLEYQAGVPPDYFSPTGQLWGNPLYRWDRLKKTQFRWFVQRFQHLLTLVDWIRVDHFRGFQAYWQIHGSETTAMHGHWIEAPGKALFLRLRKELGHLPIIAEDLGVITPEVEQLRDFFHFPGMRVLQFAFGSDAKNPHLPHNYIVNSVVYTGTHDNEPLVAWWNHPDHLEMKQRTLEYLHTSNEEVLPACMKALYRSIAQVVILPMQDLLHQGGESRMNTPSVMDGNWQYRLSPEILQDPHVTPLIDQLTQWTHLFGRIPSRS